MMDRHFGRTRFLPRLAGISLVELIVVIVVIGILLAVVSIAVMRARHASKSIDCKNNLRQIGLATQAFVQARNTFPYYRQNPGRRGLVLLLPYLEQQSLFAELEKLEDSEVQLAAPSFLRCDADFFSYEVFNLNYIPCGGIGSDSTKSDEVGFGSFETNSFAQIRDGLSNTVFYSERMSPDVPRFPTTFWEAAKRFHVEVGDYVENVEQFEAACWGEFNLRDINNVRPVSRAADILVQYKFGTRFTPNGPSCELASTGQTPPLLDVSSWEVYTPSSNHDGYVNVTFGDASLQSISNEIDAGVWKAVGSIAGRDGVFVP
jgi:type II secretory pathway pseudopilin PulG